MAATPAKITKEAEAKLLRSVDEILGLVGEGTSPNDAIVKIASTKDCTLDQTKLLVWAYNNAKSNQLRKQANDILGKTQHFDLADIAEIAAQLYPSVKEAADRSRSQEVAYDYSRPPNFKPAASTGWATKTASVTTAPVVTHEDDYFIKRACSLLRELDNEHAERRRQMNAARDNVDEAFGNLLGYFKQASHLPFGLVEEDATALFGAEVRPLFTQLMIENPRLIKEADAKGVIMPIHRGKAPFSYVEECLTKIASFIQLRDEFEAFTKEAGVISAKLMSEFMPEKPAPLNRGSLVKEASVEKIAVGFLGPVGEGVGHVIGHNLGQELASTVSPGPTPKLEQKSLLSLLDPAHEHKLRQIRSQGVAHDLMANDEFLQGVPPEKLTKMYNEITRIAPHASDQPLMMRSLLRRYLGQALVDPHEIEQLASIEGQLRQQQSPMAPSPPPASPA